MNTSIWLADWLYRITCSKTLNYLSKRVYLLWFICIPCCCCDEVWTTLTPPWVLGITLPCLSFDFFTHIIIIATITAMANKEPITAPAINPPFLKIKTNDARHDNYKFWLYSKTYLNRTPLDWIICSVRQVFDLHRFKLHRHLVDGTVKSVWLGQVFCLLGVRFSQVSLYQFYFIIVSYLFVLIL